MVNVNDIQNNVLKCLDEAEEKKLTSIAFPALGTGILTFS
jgi:O-acetyl-ADP-ribose deacetylase (regulator of RNase III)